MNKVRPSNTSISKILADPVLFAKRFWSLLDKSGECWVWTKSCSRKGYGRVCVGHERYKQAHRIAWSLVNGEIPEGMGVLHRCDNPPCCRPDHLFLGTQLDNLRDCAAKGRTNPTYGEKSVRVKLMDNQIGEIRALHGAMTSRKVATMFGVAHGTITKIWRGERRETPRQEKAS